MVEGPGQFSRRGGILDIFSPGAERPVRAEFWGDEIDSMGFFDTDTQRRAENIESFRVLPACESLVDPSRAGSIAKELLSRAARAERREQTELARRLRRDAELISTGAPLPWEQPESTNPYMKGDKVTHAGKTWVSTIDNNVWEPGVYGWEETGG